jgi:hypothetical protein
MISVRTMALLGFSLSGLVALAGCQSSGSAEGHHHDATAVAATQGADVAAHCDKCKVTWVKKPYTMGSPAKGAVTGYRETQQMECPECRGAVANFFASGKLEHHCNACGGNLVACEGH